MKLLPAAKAARRPVTDSSQSAVTFSVYRGVVLDVPARDDLSWDVAVPQFDADGNLAARASRAGTANIVKKARMKLNPK
jgi:hypothetical protein